MLLSQLNFDSFVHGHSRAVETTGSGSVVLVSLREINGLYDIAVFGDFDKAARAADPRAKSPPYIRQWEALDALSAQCVLYEVFNDVGSPERKD